MLINQLIMLLIKSYCCRISEDFLYTDNQIVSTSLDLHISKINSNNVNVCVLFENVLH